jgi:hypothetical protein
VDAKAEGTSIHIRHADLGTIYHHTRAAHVDGNRAALDGFCAPLLASESLAITGNNVIPSSAAPCSQA